MCIDHFSILVISEYWLYRIMGNLYILIILVYLVISEYWLYRIIGNLYILIILIYCLSQSIGYIELLVICIY